MAKLHFVKKARKTYRGTGVKKGDSYYFFKHRRGPIVRSKNRPPRSSYVTTSPFLGELMDMEDNLTGSIDSGKFAEASDRLREMAQECEEKASNMEATFPNGCPTIDQMKERMDFCENLATELADISADIDGVHLGDDSDEEMTDIRDRIANLDWSCE